MQYVLEKWSYFWKLFQRNFSPNNIFNKHDYEAFILGDVNCELIAFSGKSNIQVKIYQESDKI